jgi:predicted RNase H-like HicB family nuclease/uncharacterized damage-inducible protein DinB
MVHVLDLLGCIANGPTTEEALNKTPQAIHDYLRFLHRHGEAVDPEAEVQTEIAEHITEGIWLGNGDPSLVFQPDLEPLTTEDIEVYVNRLEGMRLEMVALVGDLSEAQLEEKPQPKGRPIKAILEHILESEYAYMAAYGRPEDLPGTGSIVKKRQGDLLEWMAYVRGREIERLRSLSWQERSEPFVHWKYTRTARKVMRRMLEHQWEHLVEIKERLENEARPTLPK